MGDVVVNLATIIIPGVPGTTPMDTVTHKSLPHNYSVLFFPSLRQAIPSSHTSFATLTEFSLGVPSFTAALDILQHSRFPSIRSLTCNIHTPDAPTLSQASALLIAVVDACNAETLSSLAIGYCSEDPNEYPDQMMAYLRSEALRPLLRFSAMSSLRLLGRWSWDLDDDLIGDMARAWPELRKLHLDPDGYLSSVHRVTYRCLELVATHCPNLEAFGSVINTASSTDIDSDQLAGSGPQNTTLRRLHFGDSLIESEHVEPMAAYLTRLFPSLESITTLAPRWRSPDEVDDMERWSAVAKKMSVKYISD
ncbi:hypothetical protein EUX98_g8526 [Antrodiella citrinella]|uniref:F-box domain-containing protein n=1 Tax=Antrodiella citrinella TaxID=2447956 RepID=A0A4S4M820_9APHY|nr:hypothetical protein EUX98_g8526 [Antrodiella citrinella]